MLPRSSQFWQLSGSKVFIPESCRFTRIKCTHTKLGSTLSVIYNSQNSLGTLSRHPKHLMILLNKGVCCPPCPRSHPRHSEWWIKNHALLPASKGFLFQTGPLGGALLAGHVVLWWPVPRDWAAASATAGSGRGEAKQLYSLSGWGWAGWPKGAGVSMENF